MSFESCPLCSSGSRIFYSSEKKVFYRCIQCNGIFLSPLLHLSAHEEKTRYELHNNDVNDEGYRKFVLPVVNEILNDFSPVHSGLDFGAGTGPVITRLLSENGYQIRPYDPYFHNHPHLLKEKYDYVACCEVMEHFYNPKKEFIRLKQMLKSAGKLYCMTVLFNGNEVDFSKWYYKNDLTHVFFYCAETLKYIQKQFGFSCYEVKGRLIIFSE